MTYICTICGLPSKHASMGGPGICPACDCGKFRDGTDWSYRETVNPELIRAKAQRPRCEKCGHYL
jgi:hypothetical protein